MRNTRLLILCLLLAISVSALAQWQPIEGSHYRYSWGGSLYFDEKTDVIGLYAGNYFQDQVTLVWDIDEREWEVIDRISRYEERLGFDLEETDGTILFSKKLNRWINICAIYQDGDLGPNIFQLWKWEKEGWEVVKTQGPAPWPRTAFASAVDDQGLILFFGGYTWNWARFYDDTWTLDGTNWRKINTNGPSRRHYSSMAFDIHRRQFVLFGGEKVKQNIEGKSEVKHLNDTWLFANDKWKKLPVDISPRPRAGSFMFYHPKLNQIILYGGYKWRGKKYGKHKYTYFSDIWRWTGKRWIRMVKDTNTEGKIILGPATYDSRRDRMIAFYKNQLWEYRFSNKN